jgi:hypothetical protein
MRRKERLPLFLHFGNTGINLAKKKYFKNAFLFWQKRKDPYFCHPNGKRIGSSVG